MFLGLGDDVEVGDLYAVVDVRLDRVALPETAATIDLSLILEGGEKTCL